MKHVAVLIMVWWYEILSGIDNKHFEGTDVGDEDVTSSTLRFHSRNDIKYLMNRNEWNELL